MRSVSSGVLAVIADAWYIDTCIEEVGIRYAAHITQATDYSAFGAPLPGRTWYSSTTSYRMGFNGKENTNEVSHDGDYLDFGARIYDSRIGRWLSVDKQSKLYPDQTPYKGMLNNPICFVDRDGNNEYIITSDGKIHKIITKDATDHFQYKYNDGTVKDLGKFEKQTGNLELIKIPTGKVNSVLYNRSTEAGCPGQNYVDPESFAGLLGALVEYNDETKNIGYVNRFSLPSGGHSGAGKGTFIDICYANTKGNVNEGVYTDQSNYDEKSSQILVDKLVKFGFDGNDGTGYPSLLTEKREKGKYKEALKHTRYPGHNKNGTDYPEDYHHRHHIHATHMNKKAHIVIDKK